MRGLRSEEGEGGQERKRVMDVCTAGTGSVL